MKRCPFVEKQSLNMRTPESKVIAAFVIVAIIQIVWHWLISTSVENGIAKVYLAYDPHSHKGNYGWFDLVIPACILGLTIGLTGWEWTSSKMTWAVVLVALGIVVVFSFCIQFFEKSAIWWWPTTASALFGYLIKVAIQSFLITGVFAIGGRGIALHYHGQDAG